MKNRFFLAISAMMVSAALLLSATAQTKIDIGCKVMLQSTVEEGELFKVIKITNNTNNTIPTGTKIYWQAHSSIKGGIVLSAPLAPGMIVTAPIANLDEISYCPSAFYWRLY